MATGTDAILAAIDGALGDASVSEDAMRWSPDPGAATAPAKTPWIAVCAPGMRFAAELAAAARGENWEIRESRYLTGEDIYLINPAALDFDFAASTRLDFTERGRAVTPYLAWPVLPLPGIVSITGI